MMQGQQPVLNLIDMCLGQLLYMRSFVTELPQVSHRQLLYILNHYRIRGSTYKWIASWLSERYQKVVLDGKTSDIVLFLSRVLQGSGPVMFLIFIHDLLDNIRSSVHLFADDCGLYRNINSLTVCQILQDDLNSLAQCETDWQMKFNVTKCHTMWREDDRIHFY